MIRNTVDDTINLLKDIVVPIIKTRTVLLCDDSKENFQSTTNEDDEDDTDDILNSLEEAVKGAFVIALSRSFAEEVELDDGSTKHMSVRRSEAGYMRSLIGSRIVCNIPKA